MHGNITINGITITPPPIRHQELVLTAESLAFIGKLHQQFEARRQELMKRRHTVRAKIANGQNPRFLEETRSIREDNSWKVAPLAPGLEDRRVEITGPTDRKMTINALNSGAKIWLADFEDASAPTWENVIGGQVNMIDAYERRIDFTSPEGKTYALGAPDVSLAGAELGAGRIEHVNTIESLFPRD